MKKFLGASAASLGIVVVEALSLLLMTAGAATRGYAQTSSSASSTTTKHATTHHATRATHTAATHRSLLNPDSLNQIAPPVFKAKFTTTKGVFVVEVTRAWSPHGADRFYNLVKNGFFTNASLFRVVPGFVVQFGINAKPEISKVWSPAKIPDDAIAQSNKRGYVTFATGGPNTRTTQIFINLADNTSLDGQGFSPFGQVVEGMDVVDKFFSGYGEQITNLQGQIEAQGNAFLKASFPNLDNIVSAMIEPPPSAVRKPSASHTTHATHAAHPATPK